MVKIHQEPAKIPLFIEIQFVYLIFKNAGKCPLQNSAVC
jgi:hypothetical protein